MKTYSTSTEFQILNAWFNSLFLYPMFMFTDHLRNKDKHKDDDTRDKNNNNNNNDHDNNNPTEDSITRATTDGQQLVQT